MRRVVAIVLSVVILAGCGSRERMEIVVGSKNFTEQIILAELLAQHIETRTGVKVVRRHNLGGTSIAHRAVAAGEIDLYVEYTGTALTAVLNDKPSRDPQAVLARVRRGYAERFALEVLEPLGFDNTFAIVVRGDDAKKHNLRTISDLMGAGRKWRAGFGYEFKERPDGFNGLVSTYHLQFANAPRFMELGLLYRALQESHVDVVAGSATDGVIAALGMVVLQDDRRYFPPYEAAPVVNRKALTRFPALRGALESLAGRINAEEMRRMNYAVDGQQRDVALVAREFLAAQKLR